MADAEYMKYDDVLTNILVNEKSILGFLSAIFNFLARRTDFYYVPKDQYENMGFPPGVAEELVIKVLRKCDPKNWVNANSENSSNDLNPVNINNEIMCSTVAQEVEVVAEEDIQDSETANAEITTKQSTSNDPKNSTIQETNDRRSCAPPVIPIQMNSDAYNGAEREKYTWSQTIMELDVIVKLPPDIKSSKHLKVTINSGDICVACVNGETIIKDTLPYKIKTIDSFWSISEGRLLMHFEKVQERWWNKFLNCEEPIDLSKIDCSRPLDDLPEDHVAKVRELQWNQERKLKGLPTSDEIRKLELLKKAWNAPGSPFKGKEFDPSVLDKPNVTFREAN